MSPVRAFKPRTEKIYPIQSPFYTLVILYIISVNALSAWATPFFIWKFSSAKNEKRNTPIHLKPYGDINTFIMIGLMKKWVL